MREQIRAIFIFHTLLGTFDKTSKFYPAEEVRPKEKGDHTRTDSTGMGSFKQHFLWTINNQDISHAGESSQFSGKCT